MEYVYSALLLHSSGQPITEDNVKRVLESAGATIDENKIKALVASLEGVDIEEAMSKAAISVAASGPAEVSEDEKEDEDDENKKDEEAAAGLSALFG